MARWSFALLNDVDVKTSSQMSSSWIYPWSGLGTEMSTAEKSKPATPNNYGYKIPGCKEKDKTTTTAAAGLLPITEDFWRNADVIHKTLSLGQPFLKKSFVKIIIIIYEL